MEKTKTDINALTRIYDFLLWLIPVLEKFPRTQKFLLADRIEALVLDIMERVIQAVYTRDKTAHLMAANLKIEQARYLIRLAKDLKHLSINRYEFAAKSLNEIGAEIGGWLKYARSRP